MDATDIILFDATWVNDTTTPTTVKTYGTFKDLYASKAKEEPGASTETVTSKVNDPALSGTNQTVFKVTRALKVGKDKFSDLEKNQTYKFVYALGTKKFPAQHDYAGQYVMKIDVDGAVTLTENAKKMYASAAALVGAATISYLI